MNKFEHFILTRFNVKTEFSQSSLGLDPNWLSHRFQLFHDYCYPSVRAQYNQDFKWIVYFDSETPQAFKNLIDEYAKWENFIPIYVNGQFSSELNKQTILNLLNNQTQYLITTRLDNDDAISKDFIKIIQDNFHEQKLEFINLANGYVLSEGKLYWFQYLSNPFISLIEKIHDFTTDGFKTVASGYHTQVSSFGKLRQVKTKPTWMQVIHGKNVSNRIRGIRQPITRLGNDFLISPECVPKQDDLIPYLFDKTVSLIKAPIDSIAVSLPKEIRASLRKLLFS